MWTPIVQNRSPKRENIRKFHNIKSLFKHSQQLEIAYPIIEGGVVIATKSAEKYGDLSAEQKEDYKIEISAYKMKEKQVEKVAQGLRIVTMH